MATHRTAKEVEQHPIEVMGEELGTLYHALWNELGWLFSKWGEYVELFGTKPSRIELVNRVAGHFFRIVQDSLWEGCLLHIARLTDPPRSAGRENLTIKRLPDLITNEEIKIHLSGLIQVAVEKADFCRDWRNRRIAHKDLGLAMKTGVESLKPGSRAAVKEVLGSISDVLNAVSGHYMDSTTMFEGAGGSDNAVSLLYVLDDGLRAGEERNWRRKAGNYQAEDFRARDL